MAWYAQLIGNMCDFITPEGPFHIKGPSRARYEDLMAKDSVWHGFDNWSLGI